jgi:PTS system mannose-specific IID component
MNNKAESASEVILNEKKIFKTIFWRQFQLLGCMSHTRMQGIGYGWTLAPILKEIYPDNDQYLEALKRESMFFNTTQALAPFIMGLTVSMEKENADNPDFDVNTINGVKIGLMGPFAGIGDTFFYATLRVIITSLVIGLAVNGNVMGPILYVLLYNIPNYLIRYFGCVYGYRLGSQYITQAAKTGLLDCITKAASIVGLMMIGCMSYSMVKFTTTLEVAMEGSKDPFVLQTILDSICVGLIPLALVLGSFVALRKKIAPNWVLIGLVAFGFIATFIHLV